MANFHSINGNEIEAHYAGGELLQTVELAMQGITGDVTESAAWLQRTSTSNGPTTAKGIHGRTLRWNQLADNGNFANGSTHWAARESTLTVADGVATATPNSDGAARGLQASSTMGTAIVGHKYLISTEFNTSEATNINISFSGANPVTVVVPSTGAWHKCGAIWTSGNDTSFLPYLLTTASVTTSAQLKYRNVQIFDLTQMFGAGNEPSTVAEFEALFPEPYYEYDAGSLLSVSMEGIATEDANGDPIQTRTIDVASYFPDGMRSAGSVADELTETQAVVRVGSVDLGTLDWNSISTPSDSIFRSGISGLTPSMKFPPVTQVLADAKLANYALMTYEAISGSDDMSFAISPAAAARLVIIDKRYTDAAAFKAAMSGVMLYYALATPTVTPIDPPLNLTYKVEQGGTERVMVPDGTMSSPPTLVTAQGYTAESLRDAALSAIAPVENGTASTNYAVGSYLVHGGQLCRVTTAIATGEAITIGTNVVATTVMAEILSLIQ